MAAVFRLPAHPALDGEPAMAPQPSDPVSENDKDALQPVAPAGMEAFVPALTSSTHNKDQSCDRFVMALLSYLPCLLS